MSATITATNILIDGKSLLEGSCLDVEQEQIDVTTMVERDPNWTHLDTNGHMHAYGKDGSLPTLEPREREVETVPDDSYTVEFSAEADDEEVDDDFWSDDEGTYTITEYHCRICDEVVTPGTRGTVGRKYAPGRLSWRVRFRSHVKDVGAESRLVSVWTERDGKVHQFGVGQLRIERMNSEGFMEGTVNGIGELGTRD
jgi:hypothetical protein